MRKQSAKLKAARPTFGVAVNEEQMNAAEAKAATFAVSRRIALATLGRSADELMDSLNETVGEALLDSAKTMNEHLEWLKAEAEIVQAAQARLFAVLSYKFPA